MTPSSAATTRMAISAPCAPRARMAVKAARTEMAKNPHPGRPFDQIGGILVADPLPPGRAGRALFVGGRLGDGHRARLESELADDDGGGVVVDLLIDAGHDAVGHQLLDDVNRAGMDALGQVADGDVGRDIDDFVAVVAHFAPPVAAPRTARNTQRRGRPGLLEGDTGLGRPDLIRAARRGRPAIPGAPPESIRFSKPLPATRAGRLPSTNAGHGRRRPGRGLCRSGPDVRRSGRARSGAARASAALAGNPRRFAAGRVGFACVGATPPIGPRGLSFFEGAVAPLVAVADDHRTRQRVGFPHTRRLLSLLLLAVRDRQGCIGLLFFFPFVGLPPPPPPSGASPSKVFSSAAAPSAGPSPTTTSAAAGSPSATGSTTASGAGAGSAAGSGAASAVAFAKPAGA